MTARLCNTEIVPVGYKKGRLKEPDNCVCQKYLLVAVSHSVVQTELAEKKKKRKKEKKKIISEEIFCKEKRRFSHKLWSSRWLCQYCISLYGTYGLRLP
jgi:hypothetical protein